MQLYTENLKFLQEAAPALHTTVVSAAPLFPLSLESVAGQQNYILQSDKARCFIHSLYDLDNEMKLMFQKTAPDTKTIILFGLGCGHALDYITKHFTSVEHLVIIEPSLQLFKNLLFTINLKDLFQEIKQVTIIVNKNSQETEDFLKTIVLGKQKVNFSFVYSISYRTLFQQYFDTIHECLLKIIRATTINLLTDRFHQASWIKNTTQNLRQKSIPLEAIASEFKGKTAVIVAAGPSLNKDIHLLEKVKEKAVILAVGTAIRILDKKGIVPHFRTAMDGNAAEKTTIFDHIDTAASSLLYANILYHEILPQYLGSKIQMILNTDYLAAYLYRQAGLTYLEIDSNFSIATTTLDLLCKTGCSKIVLVGQDLCYTDGELYAKGARETEKIDFASNTNKYVKTKNIYGQEVYTIKSFLGMRDSIEGYINKYPEIEFINASGGLPLKGARVKSLAAVLQEDLAGVAPLPAGLAKITIDSKLAEERVQKIAMGMTIMEQELAEIERINLNREKLLRKVKKYRKRKVKLTRILKELQHVNTLEKNLQAIDFYKQVLVKELASLFAALDINFAYEGQDKQEQATALEKKLGSRMLETKIYLALLKENLAASKEQPPRTQPPGTVLF